MKVFFGYTQNAAVSYYRFISFAKYMRKLKSVSIAYSKYSTIDSEIFPWQNHLEEPGVLRQIEVLTGSADVSVFGAFSNPMAVAMVQAVQEKYKKPILMEIDDYVFTLPSYNAASNTYKPGNMMEWIIQKQLSLSDGLIVSTNTLKKQYDKFNKNIYVVPNGIDLDIWKKVKIPKKTNKRIRIGFAGSPNHSGDIRLIKPVILEILRKYPNVEFYFLGCCPDFIKHDRIIMEDNWVQIDKYPQEFASKCCDIAIAPLKDNNFNRGKSNLRWLEMSMLNLPVVASSMPAYNESIKDGETGLIADNNEEWVKSLSKLIEDKELRLKIGKNAYNDVIYNYDIADISKDYIKILKEVKRQK